MSPVEWHHRDMESEPLLETCRPGPTLWVTLGQATYLGPSIRHGRHSGAVDCLAVGVDAPFVLETTAASSEPRRLAYIPARTPNRLLAAGWMLFIYLDPASPSARTVRARFDAHRDAVSDDSPGEDLVTGYLQQTRTPDPGRVLCLLTEADPRTSGTRPDAATPPRPRPVDPRIRDAMAFLRSRPSTSTSAAQVASAVGLSTSRFLHLFSEHAGTSFRRYRLWSRMLSVGQSVAAGHTLTRAASDAGFASPSHFSDAFRNLFGLSAIELLAHPPRIIIEP
jgi:methylphosphotriester-DNA--protein-cysteine methyltransferase